MNDAKRDAIVSIIDDIEIANNEYVLANLSSISSSLLHGDFNPVIKSVLDRNRILLSFFKEMLIEYDNLLVKLSKEKYENNSN